MLLFPLEMEPLDPSLESLPLPLFASDLILALLGSVPLLVIVVASVTVSDSAMDGVSGVEVTVDDTDDESAAVWAFIRILRACSNTSCVMIPSQRTSVPVFRTESMSDVAIGSEG